MDDPVKITNHLFIPLAEFTFYFARSGGKGGQNVNKVETRVELLFDVAHSAILSDHQRERLLEVLRSRIDKQGMLRVVAQDSRSQWRNRELAIERFAELLQKALKPKKKRIATKTPPAAKEQRLVEKKRRREIIRARQIEE